MPDDPGPRRTEPELSATARLVDKHIGAAIAVAAFIGVVVDLAALAIYNCACAGSASPLCDLVAKEPPWLLVTGIAAAPAVLLTWYWRTTQRRLELSLRQRELDQRDRDHQATLEARTHHDAATVESELTTFEREIIGPDIARAQLEMNRALRLMDRAPNELNRMCAAIQEGMRYQQGKFTPEDLVEWSNYTSFLRSAFRAISKLQQLQGIPMRMNLSGITLQGLNLEGHSLRNINFRHSTIVGVKLQGADLRGSDFEQTSGHSVEYDKLTQFDESQEPRLKALRRPHPLGKR